MCTSDYPSPCRDSSPSSAGSKSYSFVMPALADHLRAQAEHNSKASYFNIDIIKYQVGNSSALSMLRV